MLKRMDEELKKEALEERVSEYIVLQEFNEAQEREEQERIRNHRRMRFHTPRYRTIYGYSHYPRKLTNHMSPKSRALSILGRYDG